MSGEGRAGQGSQETVAMAYQTGGRGPQGVRDTFSSILARCLQALSGRMTYLAKVGDLATLSWRGGGENGEILCPLALNLWASCSLRLFFTGLSESQ